MKENLNLQAKIGKEYVKISSIQKEINKFQNQSDIIQSRIESTTTRLLAANRHIKIQSDVALAGHIKVAQIEKELVELAAERAKHASGTNGYNQLTNDIQAKRVDLVTTEAQLKSILARDDVRQLAMLKYQKHIADGIAQNLEDRLETQRQVNASIDVNNQKLGSLGALLKGISKIPIIGQFIQTEKILDRMEDTMERTGSRWKTFGSGVKGVGLELGRIFSSPIVLGGILVGIFAKLIQGVFEYDKSLTETAKTLAISKDSAQDLYKHFQSVALNANDAFITVLGMGKALNELNNSFGTMVRFSDEQLRSQIELTEKMGIQGEEAMSIQRFSMLNKKSVDDTLKSMIKQNDSVISHRKVIADVAKINGQLVAQYRNSPELLAKAVVEANKLGISLDQAKKAADGLLNFQSSIESELEAELLTGKAINLEKARALALDGQSAEAAKEMLNQVGSFEQYSRLNVLQQRLFVQHLDV